MNRVTNKVLGIVFIIIFAVTLSSCGAGGGGGNEAKTFDDLAAMVKKMDVSGAQGFVLTGSSGAAAKASSRMAKTALTKAADNVITLEENSIYKVTDDGRLERVPVTDEMGSEVPRGTVQPFDIRDLDGLYVIFWFKIGGEWEPVPYLVHKPTGLAYRASDVIPAHYLNENTVRKEFHYERDASGNLYFDNNNSYFSRVMMVDGSGIGSGALTARKLEIPEWDISSWAVDANDSFLVYTGKSADGSAVCRFLDIRSGVLTNMFSIDTNILCDYWGLGPDGKVYGRNKQGEAIRIERGADNKPLVYTIGYFLWTWASDGRSMKSSLPGFYTDERHIIGGKEFFFHNGSGERYAIEIDLDQAKIVEHDLPRKELSLIKKSDISGNFIFYVGTSSTTSSDVILRYDPISMTATTFDPGADYDMNLDRVKVLGPDTIWFEALRLSDQAKVIGKMASDGTVTILDVVVATEPQIIIMEAIHPTDFLTINGDVQEWSLDKRIQQDIASDAVQGDDLRYYSEQKSKTNYFGLVEFEENKVSSDSITRITIDDMYQIRIGSSSSEFRNLLTDTSSMLRNIGGISAIGTAVEFSVPLNALTGATLKDIKVARVKEDIFGDVSTITPVKNGTDWTLTLGMATPLGDATVEIELVGSYVLRFDKTVAMIDDGITQNDLTTLGGSIVYPASDGGDITVVIPVAAIGSPAGLSPAEQSSGEIFDVVIDIMGE